MKKKEKTISVKDATLLVEEVANKIYKRNNTEAESLAKDGRYYQADQLMTKSSGASELSYYFREALELLYK